jgi:hypothetical protein
MRIRERNKKKNSLLNFIGVPFMLLTNPPPLCGRGLGCEVICGDFKLICEVCQTRFWKT